MRALSSQIHPLAVFEENDPVIVPLVTPRILFNAIKVYQLTIRDFAMLAQVQDRAVSAALAADTRAPVALIEIYIALRAYEARMAHRFCIFAGALRRSRIHWPRLRSDHEFAEYCHDDWMRAGSVKVANGVQRAAARSCRVLADVRVDFVAFDETGYQAWLHRHGLLHTQFSLLDWAQHQTA